MLEEGKQDFSDFYPEDAYQGRQPTSEIAWLRLHSSWQLVREYLGQEVIQKDEQFTKGCAIVLDVIYDIVPCSL